MASYSQNDLYGAGVPIEAIASSANKTFTFTNTGAGSAYFTMETVRNENGFYDTTRPANAVGVYSTFNNIDNATLVTSSYMASVTIPLAGGSFKFSPTTNIAVSSSMLRATGGVTLVIS